jgi:hypothetical protein
MAEPGQTAVCAMVQICGSETTRQPENLPKIAISHALRREQFPSGTNSTLNTAKSVRRLPDYGKYSDLLF